MTTLAGRSAALLAMAAIAGAAFAQSDSPWDGVYVGVNAGEASSSTCNSWALNGAWSITAEYLHANFGKGSNSTTTCSGSVPACAAFSGISFDNIHEGFSANIVRVGITYWFGYWEPVSRSNN